MNKWALQVSDSDVEACCADFYASDVVKWLLEDSCQPGGIRLTGRMGEYLGLGPGDELLDVASGAGASAMLKHCRRGMSVSMRLSVGAPSVHVESACCREDVSGSVI